MNQTYEWLYENYAEDLQKKMMQYEEDAINLLLQIAPFTDNQRVKLADCLAELRFHWGVDSFALGVQFGLRLTTDYWEELPYTGDAKTS